MLQALDAFAMNFEASGKGDASKSAALEEVGLGGACALQLRQDWGTAPGAIDRCLAVADAMDVQVMPDTDTLNKSGFVETTVAATKGRTIYAFHTDGADGGHAPDIIKLCGLVDVIRSSTDRTRPFTVSTFDQYLDMLIACHRPDRSIPEDVACAAVICITSGWRARIGAQPWRTACGSWDWQAGCRRDQPHRG